MIKRKYFKIIEDELNKKQITALIGLRQVGKTTILEHAQELVKESSIFIKFDNVEILNFFENDIEFFIEQYVKPYKYIFIDEIQYSKTSGQKLKYIYDSFKDKKILVSGSSLPEIAIHSLSYLVGRVNIIQVFPIDFEEFLEFKSSEKVNLLEKMRSNSQLKLIQKDFNEYLQFGGYPEVILSETNEEKRTILSNIVNTYLLKEIREILNFENVFEFEKTLKRIALSDGGIMNKSNISAELEINRVSFNKIIDILYKTAILYPLQPFLKNKIKELVKSPKIYLSDLGFKNTLINNFNNIELRQDKGQIFENFVLTTILNFNLDPKFWNYRNEFEVDFVLEGNDYVFGIECKSSLKDDNITTSMKKFISEYKPKELIILNSKIESVREINQTKVIFTNHLNIFNKLKEIKKLI
jgi:predicted AAA+ superfamily ATPase